MSTAGVANHHQIHASGGRDPIQIAQSQVTGLATELARARMNVLGAWSSTTAYQQGDAPHRYGVVYEAVTASTGFDPISDDGTHWKAIGEHVGQGALFNADWRDAQLGNQGASGAGSSVVNNNLADIDHVLTQAADRLQLVPIPTLCGRPALRFEARNGDHDGTKNRTEVTATGAGKAWYAGDEMWFAYDWLPHKSYPLLSAAGSFHVMLQLYGQDLYAQGGGQSTIAVAFTIPSSGTWSIQVTDARSFTSTGSINIPGSRTATYSGKTGDTLTGCLLTSGATGFVSGGGVISQNTAATTTSGSHTLPTSSITVASTSGFTPSGIITVGTQAVTYTSKDATHFLGCTGGSGTITNGSTVNGQISGGSPPFALEMSSDGTKIFAHIRGGSKQQQTDASTSDTSVQMASATIGVNHKYLFHGYLSTGSDGFWEVWHTTTNQFSAVPQAEVHGPNVTSIQGHTLPIYPEFGIYSDVGAATMVTLSHGLRSERTRRAAMEFYQHAPTQLPMQWDVDLTGLSDAQITALIPTTLVRVGTRLLDSTNNKERIWNGTTWKSVTIA